MLCALSVASLQKVCSPPVGRPECSLKIPEMAVCSTQATGCQGPRPHKVGKPCSAGNRRSLAFHTPMQSAVFQHHTKANGRQRSAHMHTIRAFSISRIPTPAFFNPTLPFPPSFSTPSGPHHHHRIPIPIPLPLPSPPLDPDARPLRQKILHVRFMRP